jgi:hypothetical protein
MVEPSIGEAWPMGEDLADSAGLRARFYSEMQVGAVSIDCIFGLFQCELARTL